MQIKQKLRLLNWRRNFFFKKISAVTGCAVFHILSYFFPKRTANLSTQGIKSILLIRNDKIGDMVVTTGLIEQLIAHGYSVSVSTSQAGMEIIRCLPNKLESAYIFDDSSCWKWLKSLMAVREKRFDLVVDLRLQHDLNLPHLLFCIFTKSDRLMGFNKSRLPTYNASISYLDGKGHITKQLVAILNYLGIAENNYQYQLVVDGARREQVKAYVSALRKKGEKIIIFNPYGGADIRKLTQAQIEYTIQWLSQTNRHLKVIMIGEPKAIDVFKHNKHVDIFNSSSVVEVIPLIEFADQVVSVDTSIVHIATAFQKPTIAFYLQPTLKLGESPNDIKRRMNHQYEKFRLLTFIRQVDDWGNFAHIKPEDVYVNSSVWAPNNPNAQQITFTEYTFSEVSFAEFCDALAAKKIQMSA
jgi:ADP-heptose:LPS heptosyltransferase